MLRTAVALWYRAPEMRPDAAAITATEPAAPVAVGNVVLRRLRLQLREPFETSFGAIDSRLIFLVGLEAGGLLGWGEVVAAEDPLYSYETVSTSSHIIRECPFPKRKTSPPWAIRSAQSAPAFSIWGSWDFRSDSSNADVFSK